jgi:hypothetical protein
MQLSNRMSYRLSYSCLIVALYPLYDSPAGRGVPLAYVSDRLVPDNPRRGTLNIPFVGRSGLSKQTQEVVKRFLSRLGKLKAPRGKKEKAQSKRETSSRLRSS